MVNKTFGCIAEAQEGGCLRHSDGGAEMAIHARVPILRMLAVTIVALGLLSLPGSVTAQNGQTGSGSVSQLLIAVQPATSEAGSQIAGPPTVRVLNEDGNPVTNVVVKASLDRDASLGGTTLLRTGSDGMAVFEDLLIAVPGSQYRLTFQARNLSSSTNEFEVLATGPGPVAGGTVTSQPSGAGEATVTLSAVDAQGRSVSGMGASDFAISTDDCASSTPMPEDPRWTDFTADADGYTVLFHEAPDVHAFDFCADVAGTNVQIADDHPVTIEEVRPTTLVLLNQPRATEAGHHIIATTEQYMRVKVRDQFGHAIAGQVVAATGAPFAEWAEATTSREGIAAFADLPGSQLVINSPGIYTVTFATNGVTVQTSQFEVSQSQLEE
jgi:hypothetical protein